MIIIVSFDIFIIWVLNIGNGVYADLSFNSVETESAVIGDCQLPAYAIIWPRGSYVVNNTLYYICLKLNEKGGLIYTFFVYIFEDIFLRD